MQNVFESGGILSALQKSGGVPATIRHGFCRRILERYIEYIAHANIKYIVVCLIHVRARKKGM